MEISYCYEDAMAALTGLNRLMNAPAVQELTKDQFICLLAIRDNLADYAFADAKPERSEG